MKVVIVGQKKLGLQVLELAHSYAMDIVLVVAPADDNLLLPKAISLGIKVQTVGMDPCPLYAGSEFPEFDYGFTAHSFHRISDSLLQKAKHGWLGYHPSLLPRHRGKAAVEAALDAKDCITGGTLYWLNEKMDAGRIAWQEFVFLDHAKTPKQLWDDDLLPIGKHLFHRAIMMIRDGEGHRIPRSDISHLEKFATYCKSKAPAPGVAAQ
jgi:methionyl-tRNA formyltransferase